MFIKYIYILFINISFHYTYQEWVQIRRRHMVSTRTHSMKILNTKKRVIKEAGKSDNFLAPSPVKIPAKSPMKSSSLFSTSIFFD